MQNSPQNQLTEDKQF